MVVWALVFGQKAKSDSAFLDFKMLDHIMCFLVSGEVYTIIICIVITRSNSLHILEFSLLPGMT